MNVVTLGMMLHSVKGYENLYWEATGVFLEIVS
jgi:hypothetical protein